MSGKRNSVVDRRSGEESRQVHDLHFFMNRGVNQRILKDRRLQSERRLDWIKESKWHSVNLEAIGIHKFDTRIW